MSTALFNNFITSDILQDTNLKPWYESVRGYLVFANVLVSIYMVYDVKSDKLMNCVPMNSSVKFDASTTAYANSYCSAHELHWHERNLGLLCLISSLLVYLSYSWWLMVPGVKKSFALIRECDEALKELKGTPKDLKETVKKYFSDEGTASDYQTEEAPKLIVTCHRLWCDHEGMSLRCLQSIINIYILRNIISGSFVIAGAVIVGIFSPLSNNQRNPLICDLDILNDAQARCFVTSKDKLTPFAISILVVSSALIVWTVGLIVYVIWKNRSKHRSRDDEPCVREENDSTACKRDCGPVPEHSKRRRNSWEEDWTELGLKESDFRRAMHGEDCNQFAEIFSESSTPFSNNTKTLMYFSEVFERDHWQLYADRFREFVRRLESEQITGYEERQRDDTAVLNNLRGMHGKIREEHNFEEFLKEHRKTFDDRFQKLSQALTDFNCKCDSLFAKEVTVDSKGKSLMWYVLKDLNTSDKRQLAVHLLLAGFDRGTGEFRPSAKIQNNESPVNHLKSSGQGRAVVQTFEEEKKRLLQDGGSVA